MALAIAALQGCLAVAAAAGAGAGVAYAKGDLEATLDGTPPEIVSAAEAALEDMEIAVTAARSTALDGEVRGETARDKDVSISVAKRSDATSRLSIRVGTFGDESMSRAIYDRIRARLD
jgi:hypothetical protein